MRTMSAMVMLVAALGSAPAAAQDRASAEGRDVYGYSLLDSGQPDRCTYDWIDTSGGSVLNLVPGRPGAVTDDRAAVLVLDEPFELYSLPLTALVVSGNGYLAAGAAFAAEDGTDYSNDCGLPAIADNPTASQDRIYAYHDDLRPRAGGQVRKRYFPSCPRADGSGVAGSCTVVEWDGFERVGNTVSTTPLRMQAVLYHASQAIVVQYAGLDDTGGASATVGLQGYGARSAKLAQCGRSGERVQAGGAICWFDPRHPPR